MSNEQLTAWLFNQILASKERTRKISENVKDRGELRRLTAFEDGFERGIQAVLERVKKEEWKS